MFTRNKTMRVNNRFVQEKLLLNYESIGGMCQRAIQHCEAISNIMPQNTTSQRNEEIKGAKDDLNSLYQTIISTLESIGHMYTEHSYAMYKIFDIAKMNREDVLSKKIKQQVQIDASKYTDDIYEMYKFIKKYCQYIALKHDAKHVFKSFIIWYNYAVNSLNTCLNRLKFIVHYFDIDDSLEMDITKIQEKMMQTFN